MTTKTLTRILFSQDLATLRTSKAKQIQVHTNGFQKYVDIIPPDFHDPHEYGLRLSLQQWSNLVYHIPFVNLALEEIRKAGEGHKTFNLGTLFYLEVLSFEVWIYYHVSETVSKTQPLRSCIHLSHHEWMLLTTSIEDIDAII